MEIGRRTRWWGLKCVIVYLERDIPPIVMYCIYGESGSSLLIESTDSMIFQTSHHRLPPISQVKDPTSTLQKSGVVYCICTLYNLLQCVCWENWLASQDMS